MSPTLTSLAARFDALQTRERRGVMLAILLGIVLIGGMLSVEPALRRGRAAEREQLALQTQKAELVAQMTALQAPERDPDTAARAELAQSRTQLEALAGRLQTWESALVPPDRMAGLLEEMIGKRSGLRLLSLKTLPVSPFPAAGARGEESAAAVRESSGGLWMHGIEIRLEGSYAELAAYIARLEQSRLKLLWRKAELSAETHPRLVLTLTVYSLSMDRAWLIV